MAQLVYRVVSACGALGYGFPKASLDAALEGRVDAVISDAGSMDAGPYYLGTGTQYFERDAVKADFTLMVQAAAAKGCPLILGSSGMAGGDRNLAWMVDVAKEVFAEQDVTDWKVATIDAELTHEQVLTELRAGRLHSLGEMPALTEEMVADSVIVGQMGIHPLITALDAGARCVLAGRSCDIALFASDMIRRGIDPGLAFHVGHVLECGALACDPGSPSDCLVAEIYDDGTALFVAPNPDRACTPYSIAAHSLYEESHPQLQFYPEGVLCMEHTEFFSRGAGVAGIRGSVFAHTDDLTIKLEGARRVGRRRVSVVPFDAAALASVPADVMVYGRNGVEAAPVAIDAEREIGMIIETRAAQQRDATLLASLMAHYLVHYGYPGRKATAGNVAYPISPNLIEFTRDDGSAGAVVVQGTRDPVFQEHFDAIWQAVQDLIRAELPEALEHATFTMTIADADHPVAYLRTVDTDEHLLATRHQRQLDALTAVAHPTAQALLHLAAPDFYEWTIYHLFANRDVIENDLFPIHVYTATGADWVFERTERATYFDVGVVGYVGDIGERTLSTIAPGRVPTDAMAMHALRDMAVVIRTKDAGINRLTYDIVFNSVGDYRTALRSNVFAKENIVEMLPVGLDHVVGTFRVDTCNAIKVSVDRPIISASVDERDVFGAQQQSEFILMTIPVVADAAERSGAI
jgi:hypothetical protein